MLSQPLLWLIAAYRRFVSPLTGDCCRFEPSCSRYGQACIHHHGGVRGSWLTLKRLLRCNPLFRGGYDPPPVPAAVAERYAEPDWQRISALSASPTAEKTS